MRINHEEVRIFCSLTGQDTHSYVKRDTIGLLSTSFSGVSTLAPAEMMWQATLHKFKLPDWLPAIRAEENEVELPCRQFTLTIKRWPYRVISKQKSSTQPQHPCLWNLQQDGLVWGDNVPIHVQVALHWLPWKTEKKKRLCYETSAPHTKGQGLTLPQLGGKAPTTGGSGFTARAGLSGFSKAQRLRKP